MPRSAEAVEPNRHRLIALFTALKVRCSADDRLNLCLNIHAHSSMFSLQARSRNSRITTTRRPAPSPARPATRTLTTKASLMATLARSRPCTCRRRILETVCTSRRNTARRRQDPACHPQVASRSIPVGPGIPRIRWILESHPAPASLGLGNPPSTGPVYGLRAPHLPGHLPTRIYRRRRERSTLNFGEIAHISLDFPKTFRRTSRKQPRNAGRVRYNYQHSAAVFSSCGVDVRVGNRRFSRPWTLWRPATGCFVSGARKRRRTGPALVSTDGQAWFYVPVTPECPCDDVEIWANRVHRF